MPTSSRPTVSQSTPLLEGPPEIFKTQSPRAPNIFKKPPRNPPTSWTHSQQHGPVPQQHSYRYVLRPGPPGHTPQHSKRFPSPPLTSPHILLKPLSPASYPQLPTPFPGNRGWVREEEGCYFLTTPSSSSSRSRYSSCSFARVSGLAFHIPRPAASIMRLTTLLKA